VRRQIRQRYAHPAGLDEILACPLRHDDDAPAAGAARRLHDERRALRENGAEPAQVPLPAELGIGHRHRDAGRREPVLGAGLVVDEREQGRCVVGHEELEVPAIHAERLATEAAQALEHHAVRDRPRSENRTYSSRRRPRHLPIAISSATTPISTSGYDSTIDWMPPHSIVR